MGSLQLDCPLCCNETFECLQSLKYHLLSIIDNILCPSCGTRFQTILELADHLDNECGKTSEKCAAESTDLNVINIKIENEDSCDDTINNSILAKALLSPQNNSKNVVFLKTNNETQPEEPNEEAYEDEGNEDNVQSMETDEIQDEQDATEEAENPDEEVYSCLSCGMNFTSVVDHIQEYHEGEEVVVEMSENDQNEENQELSKEDSDILQNIPEGATIISEDGVILATGYDDEDDMASNESHELLEVGGRGRMPQILNTIKQEDCVDKDGRLYTRKVVQIEKFWDEESIKPRTPIVVKYLVDSNGVLTKITNTTPEEVTETSNTIEIFQCSNCNVQFSKREQFDVHVCDPEIAAEYKCNLCDSCFTNSQSLCAHMKTHKTVKKETTDATPTGPFVCNVCDTIFPSNKSLRLHRRMHDPIKAKEIEAPVDYGLTGGESSTSKPREMFECKVCGKSYDKSYEEIHMAYHSGVNHYDCYICNRKFYTHSNLEMHMRVHGNEKGHICSHCKKGFLTEESLQQHLKQHCSSRPYQCTYCSRRFARPHEKVKHERIHTGEKPHECEICGKTFRVSYCLTLHMRTHSGYRPYVCQHCGKRFKAHSVYNHHLLTHSDVRGYKCPYCPKAFKTGVQLAGHKNSHIKPFSCTHCNRPFASLYAVRAHMETHKRENNLKYNCYLCGASYARAFALRDHIKEVHVDAPQNGSISLDIIEEGMEASTSILPDNDDISMVTLEMESTVVEMNDEVSGQ